LLPRATSPTLGGPAWWSRNSNYLRLLVKNVKVNDTWENRIYVFLIHLLKTNTSGEEPKFKGLGMVGDLSLETSIMAEAQQDRTSSSLAPYQSKTNGTSWLGA